MDGEETEKVMRRVRENNLFVRNNRRQEMYIKQRILLDGQTHSDCLKECTEDEVIKAAQSLCSGSTNKEKALTDLKNSFISSPCHIVTFMKVEGALHALVGNLLSMNSFDQLLAVECCCNLSLGDSKTCFKLAKAATPYLISILQGMNHSLMNVVILTFSNLCGSGLKACQLIHTQGVLPVLEKAVAIPDLRDQAIKALIFFTKYGSDCLMDAEVLSMVKIVLPFFETLDKVQWLIYLLSSRPFVTPVLLKCDMPMRILMMLSSLGPIQPDNILSVTSLVRILGNLSADPEGITANMMLDKWDTTLLIIKILKTSEYRHLCKEVYWSLGNILEHKSIEVHRELILRSNDISFLGYPVGVVPSS